ncbi:hypothetical protein BX070DRAFT_221531 [Coemansia spiralis]|nr:hypothetical protein BX070DRAFT_221531 [Coemansia spiralis]
MNTVLLCTSVGIAKTNIYYRCISVHFVSVFLEDSSMVQPPNMVSRLLSLYMCCCCESLIISVIFITVGVANRNIKVRSSSSSMRCI